MSAVLVKVNLFFFLKKIWNASQICMSSLHRGHANFLCIVPILVYVLPKQAQGEFKMRRADKATEEKGQSKALVSPFFPNYHYQSHNT